MDYMSTREAASKWGVSIRNIQRLLAENRIPNARKYGISWMIPSDAKKPDDLRNERRREKKEFLHLLPMNCPMFATTTIYHKPGSAAEVLKTLSNDTNARDLFYAQLLYYQGNYREAAKLSKDLLLRTKCFDTQLGCLHIISYASMYTGDYITWLETYEKVKNMPAMTATETKMKELCLASKDCSMYDCRTYPEWLKFGCFDDLPMECFPILRYYFSKYLLITRTYLGSIRVLEVVCSQTKAEGAVIAELYLQLLMAIGYHDSGEIAIAAKHFNRALDLALPDKLYAPLA
ncbi:MAG: helix-turn-helix domain-containing protein, partial [Clostridiales bacterium]|nr:helix-turn-helix domain-containing protein [Clostridiales bacterium]